MNPSFDLDLLRVFIAVVEGESVAAAARTLDMARATVRRRIEALEALAEVPLLDRTGDRIRTTDAGQMFVRGARSVLDEASALMAHAGTLGGPPRGLLRIAVPPGEPPFLVGLAVRVFRARWPKVHLELTDEARPHLTLPQGADAALCLDEPPPSGPWTVIDLVDLELALFASPAYLRQRGTPADCAALRDHDLLLWREPTGEPPSLPLRAGGRRLLEIPPLVASNNIHTVRSLAVAGVGIGCLPEGGFALPGEPSDALVPVLADVVGETRCLRLLLPNALSDVPRLRALAGALVELVEQVRGPR